ncbi:MAG: cupin domain-containing protein [Pseudomonadota bacterium]
MISPFTNVNEADWKEAQTPRGGIWKHIELSGERLGVRIEEMQPGDNSSEHHFHTLEEEHVLVLEGSATLIMDSGQYPLKAGDHVCFPGGKEDAHHIKNTSDAPFKFLVFGERNMQDVVVYPEHQVMMVKALDFKQFTYRPVKRAEAPNQESTTG